MDHPGRTGIRTVSVSSGSTSMAANVRYSSPTSTRCGPSSGNQYHRRCSSAPPYGETRIILSLNASSSAFTTTTWPRKHGSICTVIRDTRPTLITLNPYSSTRVPFDNRSPPQKALSSSSSRIGGSSTVVEKTLSSVSRQQEWVCVLTYTTSVVLA